MDRISGTGYALDGNGHRVFVDQNLAAGTDGTDAPAVWLNGLQEELASVMETGAGLALNVADNTQLLQAILILIGQQTKAFRVFAPGVTQYVVPAGIRALRVRAWGPGGPGGAGGGTAGGGGGAGGYAEGVVFVTSGQILSVSVSGGIAHGGAPAATTISLLNPDGTATLLVSCASGVAGGDGNGGAVGSGGGGGIVVVNAAGAIPDPTQWLQEPGGGGTYGIYEDGVHYASFGGAPWGGTSPVVTSGSTAQPTNGQGGGASGNGGAGGIGGGTGGAGAPGLVVFG